MFTVISVTEENDIKSIVSVHEIYGVGCIVRTQTIMKYNNISDALIFVPGVKLVERNREYSLQQIPMMQDGPVDTDVQNH